MSFRDSLKTFYGWLRPSGRIHPYYERRLPEAGTFLHGERIAKDLPILEKLAREAGRHPLTSLHFSPLPIDRKTLRWNLAEDRIKVIQAQIALVSDCWRHFEDPRLLTEEFERILLALRCAKSLDVRFTLVRKYGNSTNLMEWEDGGGSV